MLSSQTSEKRTKSEQPMASASRSNMRTGPNSCSSSSTPSRALNGSHEEHNKMAGGGEDDSSLKFEDLEILKTIGTGTFARVCLCRIKNNKTVNRQCFCAVIGFLKIPDGRHESGIFFKFFVAIRTFRIVNFLEYSGIEFFYTLSFDISLQQIL